MEMNDYCTTFDQSHLARRTGVVLARNPTVSPGTEIDTRPPTHPHTPRPAAAAIALIEVKNVKN